MTPPEKAAPYSATELALNSKNAAVELNSSIWDIKTRQIFQFKEEIEVDSSNFAFWMPVTWYIFSTFWNNRILQAMMRSGDELNQTSIYVRSFIWTRDCLHEISMKNTNSFNWFYQWCENIQKLLIGTKEM